MTKARRLGPNGEPGSSPAGASALKRPAQHGQTPPCRLTRVISGAIGGISIRHLRDQAFVRLRERQGNAEQSFPIQRITRIPIHRKRESYADSQVNGSGQWRQNTATQRPLSKNGGEQLPKRLSMALYRAARDRFGAQERRCAFLPA